MDFIRFDPATGGSRLGRDGTLVAELAEMERIGVAATLARSMDPLACRVLEHPHMACLDIGAPSTLGGLIDPDGYNVIISRSAAGIDLEGVTTPEGEPVLFGQAEVCTDGKRSGDGVINVFDIAVLLTYLFRDVYDPLYAGLPESPSLVRTVQGRTDLHAKCGAAVTRRDHLARYADDACYDVDPPEVSRLRRQRALQAAPAADRRATLFGDTPVELAQLAFDAARLPPPPPRRLSDLPAHHKGGLMLQPMPTGPDRFRRMTELNYRVLAGPEQPSGTWYTLITGAVPVRIEAVFTGLDGLDAQLSLQLFDGLPPSVASSAEVRYTRYCQYTPEGCGQRCSAIQTVGPFAMEGGTLALMQLSSRTACPFDTHVWVPARAEPRGAPCVGVDYLTVSNGDSGSFNGSAACATRAGAAQDGPASPPPSPPPSVPPLGVKLQARVDGSHSRRSRLLLSAAALAGQPVQLVYDYLDGDDTTLDVYLADSVHGADLDGPALLLHCAAADCSIDDGATSTSLRLLSRTEPPDTIRASRLVSEADLARAEEASGMVVSSYTYAFTMVVDLAITREVRPGSTLAETAVELEAEAAARVETLAQALGLGGYSLTFRTLFPPMPPPSRPPSRPPSHPAQRASTGLQLLLPLSVGGAAIAGLAMLALLARRYLGVELSAAARVEARLPG